MSFNRKVPETLAEEREYWKPDIDRVNSILNQVRVSCDDVREIERFILRFYQENEDRDNRPARAIGGEFRYYSVTGFKSGTYDDLTGKFYPSRNQRLSMIASVFLPHDWQYSAYECVGGEMKLTITSVPVPAPEYCI